MDEHNKKHVTSDESLVNCDDKRDCGKMFDFITGEKTGTVLSSMAQGMAQENLGENAVTYCQEKGNDPTKNEHGASMAQTNDVVNAVNYCPEKTKPSLWRNGAREGSYVVSQKKSCSKVLRGLSCAIAPYMPGFWEFCRFVSATEFEAAIIDYGLNQYPLPLEAIWKEGRTGDDDFVRRAFAAILRRMMANHAKRADELKARHPDEWAAYLPYIEKRVPNRELGLPPVGPRDKLDLAVISHIRKME